MDDEKLSWEEFCEQHKETLDKEFLKDVENPLDSDSFICGLLKLRQMFPKQKHFEMCVSHDTFHIMVNCLDINTVSIEDLKYLRRCGFCLDPEDECAFFVFM